MADIHREIYEFASSAGALEGYVYPEDKRDMEYLDNWIRNLKMQYRELPEEVRSSLQRHIDRTLGRAVQSLEPILGPEHRHVQELRSLLKGELPASPDDFEVERKEKAARFGK